MRIVVVSRVLNEDDIIEPFVRHHAAMADHNVLLDNGSIDHTLPILKRLREDGLALSVYRNAAVTFQEVHFNTFLYRVAWQVHGADWVVFLDADEFIDLRQTGGNLRGLLASVPADVAGLRSNMINYHATRHDEPSETLVPKRIGWRVAVPINVWKVCLRGGMSDSLAVEAGNHGAEFGGVAVPCHESPATHLAHYVTRSAWHLIMKVVVGRLKVLSSGDEVVAQGFSSQYTPVFERLLHKPAELLFDERFVAGMDAPDGLVRDPIRYEGTALRYTNTTDYRMKTVQSILSYGKKLARGHAALLMHSSPDVASKELMITPLT